MAVAVFDTAVLHSPSTAQRFYKESGDNIDRFLSIRKNSYNDIIMKKPSQKKWYEGWINRINNLKQYTDELETMDNHNDNSFRLYGGIEKTRNYNNIMSSENIIDGLMKKLFPLKFKTYGDVLNDVIKEYNSNKGNYNTHTGKGHWVTINGNHVFMEK